MCDRQNCDNPGTLRPQLTVWATGRLSPVIASLDLRVCSECAKHLEIDDVMNDEGWQTICDGLKRTRYPVPNRKLTTLTWVKP